MGYIRIPGYFGRYCAKCGSELSLHRHDKTIQYDTFSSQPVYKAFLVCPKRKRLGFSLCDHDKVDGIYYSMSGKFQPDIDFDF